MDVRAPRAAPTGSDWRCQGRFSFFPRRSSFRPGARRL
ncbi:glycosyl hydrolase [Pseudomonas aeruginosa]|nr:glycosyl hydrolase [Pseudomonas aeruginosa]MCO1779389.1 glycosyl hydrolase [Pseudomonas aeruginosa]MCO1792358.1 glycosyl hydrolase [Pseudomonas aeruginosa]MCO1797523.1 glycosyl hydrolase [Pseudomonas aeruginosa]MCO3323588.1 glycosyl hydrolase [Pseudomonas aeruginosa]